MTDSRCHGGLRAGTDSAQSHPRQLRSKNFTPPAASPPRACRPTARGARLPNSLRIVSSTGSIDPARFARMTKSHSGSNFFQPAA